MFKAPEYTTARITFLLAHGYQPQFVHPSPEFPLLMEDIGEIHAEVGELTSPVSQVIINKLLAQMDGKLPRLATGIEGGWGAQRFAFIAELNSERFTRYISGYTSPVAVGDDVDEDTQLWINRIIMVRKATVNTPNGVVVMTQVERDTVYLRGEPGYHTLRPSDIFAELQLDELPFRDMPGEVIDMRTQFMQGSVKCHAARLDNPVNYLNELLGTYAKVVAENDQHDPASQFDSSANRIFGECEVQTSTPFRVTDDFVSELFTRSDRGNEATMTFHELKKIAGVKEFEDFSVFTHPTVHDAPIAPLNSLHSYLGNHVITCIAGLLTDHGLRRAVVGYVKGIVVISQVNTVTGHAPDLEKIEELRNRLTTEIPLIVRADRHDVTFSADVNLYYDAIVKVEVNTPGAPLVDNAAIVHRPMWASGVWSQFITDDKEQLSRVSSDMKHLLNIL